MRNATWLLMAAMLGGCAGQVTRDTDRKTDVWPPEMTLQWGAIKNQQDVDLLTGVSQNELHIEAKLHAPDATDLLAVARELFITRAVLLDEDQREIPLGDPAYAIRAQLGDAVAPAEPTFDVDPNDRRKSLAGMIKWKGHSATHIQELTGYALVLVKRKTRTVALPMDGSAGIVNVTPDYSIWIKPEPPAKDTKIRRYRLHLRRNPSVAPQVMTREGFAVPYISSFRMFSVKDKQIPFEDRPRTSSNPAYVERELSLSALVDMPEREPKTLLLDITLETQRRQIPFVLRNIALP